MFEGMAETIRVIEYFYVKVPDKPGAAVTILAQLRQARINLLLFSGFPEGRQAQLDFVPEHPLEFRAYAKKMKWKVTGPKRAFLISGKGDRPGIAAALIEKLADAKISVRAATLLCTDGDRFSGVLWVGPASLKKAARVLGLAKRAASQRGLRGRRRERQSPSVDEGIEAPM